MWLGKPTFQPASSRLYLKSHFWELKKKKIEKERVCTHKREQSDGLESLRACDVSTLSSVASGFCDVGFLSKKDWTWVTGPLSLLCQK